MDAVEILKQRDDQYRRALNDIGRAIGYGNAQAILGELWDAMLDECYPSPDGVKRSIRGRMGVTVDDALPPVPKATTLRRKQQEHGGYRMVPSYSVSDMKAYAHAAIAKTLAELPANAEVTGAQRPAQEQAT